MGLRSVRAWAALAAATGMALATGATAWGAPAPAYQLVDLGTLGGESSYATAINDHGHVVGSSATADGSFHGFLWRNGRMTDLGAVTPVDINNRGEIAGTVDTPTGLAAVRWHRGVTTDLGSLGGDGDYPTAISDRGVIVGIGTTASGKPVPFRWSRGTMHALPLDSVSDVNIRGTVAGGKLVTDGFHAATWSKGTVTDLGAGPFNRSNTYGINDRGWVIGWVFSADQRERGVLWRGGTRTDVGTLGGGRTHLVAINDRGVLLAVSQHSSGEDRPALWRDGVLTDLTTRGVVADGEVVGLNDRGQIAGTIRPVFGVSHAVLYR